MYRDISAMSRRLLISFSGGETSGMMTKWLLDLNRRTGQYDEIIVVFANTGEENEKTLIFVDRCDKEFSFRVVWVEAVIHHGKRKSPTAKIVSFETASRAGQPYEDAIRKYGIPNAKFKDCTRNLKTNPIRAYAKSLGWVEGAYDLAIGLRYDEQERLSSEDKTRGIIYPFVHMVAITKPDVNLFWSQQIFRLGIAGYLGNCKTCWKKSLRKLLTVMEEDPGAFDFFERMEAQYGLIGAEFSTERKASRGALSADYRRTFFRGNLSVKDLRRIHAESRETLSWADDDSVITSERLPIGLDLNEDNGCSESCEVNFSDTGGERDET